MKFRFADAIVVTSTVALSHAIWAGAQFVPIIYTAIQRFTRSPSTDFRLDMPSVTSLALDSQPAFVGLIVIIGVVTVFATRRSSSAANGWLLTGICGQGLVGWLAMFCFSYQSFQGEMCLHHGPHFQLPEFVRSGFGIFPVTLIALLVLFVGGIVSLCRNKER